MSEINTVAQVGFEGAFVILLLTISWKLYKMKCDFNSSCFKRGDNGITIQTHNPGTEGSI